VELLQFPFRSDAAMLLCSDGLTDHLTAASVRSIVDSYNGDAAAVARELVECANEAGGRDNVTALLIAGPDFRSAGEPTRPIPAATRATLPARWFASRLALLASGALLGMLLWAVLRAMGK
jgi:hypothetical protein